LPCKPWIAMILQEDVSFRGDSVNQGSYSTKLEGDVGSRPGSYRRVRMPALSLSS
jgi:hypothetical protein